MKTIMILFAILFAQNCFSQGIEAPFFYEKGFDSRRLREDKITLECFGEISRIYLFSKDCNRDSPNVFGITDRAELLRTMSSYTLSFDDLVADKKIPNKLKHLIIQTDNVLDWGFLDAAIKASWVQQYGLHGDKFWAYDGFYGRANSFLQGASALEYSINQSDNLFEFIRFFLAQSAISSVMEHLGYWIYINSSVPVVKNGDLIAWRGDEQYPRDHHGNNDVPWMHETPAGYTNKLIFNQDPVGTVRAESVFLSLIPIYTFAYFITPNKEFTKQNKFTKFKYILYMDGHDYNHATGLWGGTKLGLKYEIPQFRKRDFRNSISFYSSYDLNARGKFAVESKTLYSDFTLGTNNKGTIGFYGASITLKKDFGYLSVTYRKESDISFIISSGFNFNVIN